MGRIPGQEGNIPQVALGAANPHPSPQIPMSKFKDLIWLYKAVCELVSIEGLYKMDSFFLRERSRAKEFLKKRKDNFRSGHLFLGGWEWPGLCSADTCYLGGWRWSL